jgi:hypothetical protein
MDRADLPGRRGDGVGAGAIAEQIKVSGLLRLPNGAAVRGIPARHQVKHALCRGRPHAGYKLHKTKAREKVDLRRTAPALELLARHRASASARPWVRCRNDRWPGPRRARNSAARDHTGTRQDNRSCPHQDTDAGRRTIEGSPQHWPFNSGSPLDRLSVAQWQPRTININGDPLAAIQILKRIAWDKACPLAALALGDLVTIGNNVELRALIDHFHVAQQIIVHVLLPA